MAMRITLAALPITSGRALLTFGSFEHDGQYVVRRDSALCLAVS